MKDFDFCHLSGEFHIQIIFSLNNVARLIAGDLLRAEQEREGSQYGDLIRTCIREGKIVPMEVTIKLLEIAMRAALAERSQPGWTNGKGRFLIDGFPRKMDQALKFEEAVCHSFMFYRVLSLLTSGLS